MLHSQTVRFSGLPNELLLQILGDLDSRDVRYVALLNRDFRWRFVDYYFDRCYEEEVAKSQWCVKLFRHAIKTNSSDIVQYLATRKNDLDLTGLNSVPVRDLYQDRSRCAYIWSRAHESFLHMAIAGDAPHAASFLAKLGADVDQDIGRFPDLPPLCLALARVNVSPQSEKDAALRIACSNALPRTGAHLLVRGADPNSIGPFGMGALHVTLKRPPSSSHWDREFTDESDIHTTLRLLLDYGATVHLPTRTTRLHSCDPQCWKSMNCDHRGQTALHLAAINNLPRCTRALLDRGANQHQLNADGYTPLYGAICQANDAVASILLGCSSEENPVVEFSRGASALHITCRFAYTYMVKQIVLRGADVNAVDSNGSGPLHEVLSQMGPGRTADVVETLRFLAQHGADPDITSKLPTPRQQAHAHPFPEVRDMFVLERPKNSRLRAPAECTEPRDSSKPDPSPVNKAGPQPIDRVTPTMWANPKTGHVIQCLSKSPENQVHRSSSTSPCCDTSVSFPALLGAENTGKQPSTSMSESVSFWSYATEKVTGERSTNLSRAGRDPGMEVQIDGKIRATRSKRVKWQPLQL
ncbi:ankyrin repeat protein [Apiospora sp. TS-2023a]